MYDPVRERPFGAQCKRCVSYVVCTFDVVRSGYNYGGDNSLKSQNPGAGVLPRGPFPKVLLFRDCSAMWRIFHGYKSLIFIYLNGIKVDAPTGTSCFSFGGVHHTGTSHHPIISIWLTLANKQNIKYVYSALRTAPTTDLTTTLWFVTRIYNWIDSFLIPRSRIHQPNCNRTKKLNWKYETDSIRRFGPLLVSAINGVCAYQAIQCF